MIELKNKVCVVFVVYCNYVQHVQHVRTVENSGTTHVHVKRKNIFKHHPFLNFSRLFVPTLHTLVGCFFLICLQMLLVER
jgi:hypothetical protein